MKLARLLYIALVVLLVACNKGGDGDRTTDTGTGDTDTPKASGKTDLAGLVITIDGTEHKLKKKDTGYKTSGGLKIKVEADRVKVKDDSGTELAKVKKKDDGFKLYRKGAEEAMLKAKRRGDGYKLLKKPSDEEIGRVEKGGGTLGGDPVSVAGGKVKRGDKVVAEIDGNVPPTAAALLATPELSAAERLAMFVFAVEIDR